MNIAIDLGNTRAKAALFEGSKLLEASQGLSLETLPSWVKARKPEALILSSVAAPSALLTEQLAEICPCLLLSPSTPLPIVNAYQSPQSLGLDRLAAAVGGSLQFPREAVLVIDAGTCLTYDYVAFDQGAQGAQAQQQYQGGAIAPGLRMRLKAMHTFTARLPLLDEVWPQGPLLGQNTRESMLSGAIHGMCAEIEGMADKFKASLGEMRIIICGGDAKFFESKLKQPIFVIPELVLFGLNEILQYNAQNQ